MSIVSIVMLCFTVITLLIVLGVALLGFFFKSWKRCLLGLCRTLTAAIIAFFAVFIFCRAVPAGNLYSLVSSLLGDIPYFSDSAALQELSGAMVYTVFMPFVFTTLFVALDLVLLIPAFFIGRAMGIIPPKEKGEPDADSIYSDIENTADEAVQDDAVVEDEAPQPQEEEKENTYKGKPLLLRLGSAGIRVVTSLVVVILVLLPLSGITYTLTEGIIGITNTAKEENVTIGMGEANLAVMDYTLTDAEGNLNNEEVSRLVNDVVAPIRYNMFVSLSYSKPMRLLCNAMVNTTDASGAARNEISQIFDVVENVIYFTAEPEQYGEKQKAAVSNIIGYVSESDLHSRVVADFISIYTNDALENGDSLFEGDLAIIGDPLFEILKNTTAESIKADLTTLGEIINIMIDYKVPANIAAALESTTASDVLTVLANEEMLYEVMSSIYANDDYRHMLAPIIDYAFTVVIRSFDPETERLYVANVREEYTDESIRNEAKVFAGVFADANAVMGLAPDLSASNDAFDSVAKMDVAALGKFIDNARESRLIGEGVKKVMVALLKTSSFDSMRGVADILINHINEDEEINMTNLLVAVQQFVKIVSLYENNSNGDTVAVANALRDLNQSCDPNTAVILKEMINDSGILNSSMLSSGDTKKDESAAKVLNVMLEKMATEEFTEEELEKEAKAVDYTMKLVQADTTQSVKEICSDKEELREMIETINESKISSAALIDMAFEDGDPTKEITDDALNLKESLDEEDVENFRTACKEYYKDQVRSGEDLTQTENNIRALSAIFDGKISEADLNQWAAEVSQ